MSDLDMPKSHKSIVLHVICLKIQKQQCFDLITVDLTRRYI